ncbi:MAG: hypothetical protein QM719_11865 [Thermomonas sp.]
MSNKSEISEGSVLWLELLSFGPPALAITLILLFRLDPILVPISFVLCAAINLYSMISTGWAADNWLKAKYQRDGMQSSIYWLRFAFFLLFGTLSLIAMVMLFAQLAG